MKSIVSTTIAATAALSAGLPGAPAAASTAFECLIEPSQVVEIRAPVDGLIAEVAVQRGDPIRRGQALVQLQSAAERAAVDSARYRAQMEGQIDAARNRVDYATKKLARQVDLQKQNYTSAQSLDEADAERRLADSELRAAIESRELARIEHRRAQEQLALRTMSAPFNGVVVDRMLNPGDLAESGSGRKPVLKVAQIDPLRVDVVMPAALFGRVGAGMTAIIVPKGVEGAAHKATVRLVDRVIDAASGTFVARLDLPNPKQTLPGGVRCQATFDKLELPDAIRAARKGG
jgi:RND family efflux transporter MFP subunit